jgi:hypothetical protein
MGMRFTLIPTFGSIVNYVQRGDPAHFLGLPMPGERVSALVPMQTTPFPVSIEMERLIKWWFRVRQWKVVANHPLWPANQECILSLDENQAIDEEVTALAQYGGKWTGGFTYTDPLSFVHDVNFSLSILNLPDFINLFQSYFLAGSEFEQILPYLHIGVVIDGIDNNFAYGDTASFYTATPADYPSQDDINGEFDCTIDGLDIQMPAVISTGSGYEDDPVTFTVTPWRFWPWNDADGNPKWDILTGALI